MSLRRTLGALAALVLSLLGVAVLTGTPTAQAVTGSPPVTQPDSVTTYAGGFISVRPLTNDSDPDGDHLALCRVELRQIPGILVGADGAELQMLVKPRVAPGVYTLTYYACDFSYLVPVTLTVTVAKRPQITVKKLPGRPGHLKVTNPADLKIRFLWGSPEARRPEGDIRIPADSSKVISVHEEQIVWVAFNRKAGVVDQGRVSGIALNRSAGPPPSNLRLSAELLRAWGATR
jgi:hypothetical protein